LCKSSLPRDTELLNQVWSLEGCPLKGQTMRMNRSCLRRRRFDQVCRKSMTILEAEHPSLFASFGTLLLVSRNR